MKPLLITLLFLFSSLGLIGQTISIEGIIRDEATNNSISNATIRLLTQTKSPIRWWTSSDLDGSFKIRVKPDHYILEISSPDYETTEISIPNSDYSVGTILLKQRYNLGYASANPLPQQNRNHNYRYIEGFIYDKSNQPLSGATVRLIGKNYIKEGDTNTSGKFKIRALIGEYILVAYADRQESSLFNLNLVTNKKIFNVGNIVLDAIRNENTLLPKEEKTEIIINTPSRQPDTEPENTVAIVESDPKPIDKNTEFVKSVAIHGIIMDKELDIALEAVSVRLLNAKNRSYVKGVTSNETGLFEMTAPEGKYTLEVGVIGYKKYEREISVSRNSPIDLGIVNLSQDAVALNAVEVVAKVPNIVVNGDTIVYNADAYYTNEDAMLRDIIKNIPGLKVDANGNLTANGKPIERILIDGREFFNNDIQLALKNLPAEMINKIQLYEEASEIAKITGFKSDDNSQVLNLEVKEEYKDNVFGNILGGYGSKERYTANGMINFMQENTQLSLLGNLYNVSEDINESEALPQETGDNQSKNIGVNINHQQSDKFKIGGSVLHSAESAKLITDENTETFLTNESRIGVAHSDSKEDERKTALNMNLGWDPSSNISINLKLSGEHSDKREKEYSEEYSYVNPLDTTKSISDYYLRTKDDLINGSLIFGFKLNKKGRVLSLSLDGKHRKAEGNGNNTSFTTYSSNEKDVDLDQLLVNEEKATNWGASLSYVEPLGKNHSLMLSYSFHNDNNKRFNNTFSKDGFDNYTLIDSTYTRHNRTRYRNQNINLALQGISEKYQYTIGLNLDPNYSHNQINIGDSLIQSLKQNLINYSATMRFMYKPRKNVSFTINYSGAFIEPSIEQLSTDTTTLNPLNKIYGNADLKKSFANNLNMQYQQSDIESGRFFTILGGFNYIFNQVADYTTIDNSGRSETSYRNVDGNWRTNLGFVFNTPLSNDDLSFDITANTSYQKNVGFMNDQKSTTNNIGVNAIASLNMELDNVESRLDLNYLHNSAQNDLMNQQNRKVSTYGVSNSTVISLPFDFDFTNNIGYNYYSGYSSSVRKSEIIWNASLSKGFLRRNRGMLKIQYFDILDKQNNIMRVVNSNYISDIRNNVIGRYFLVSFGYRFNISSNKN